VHVTKAAVAGLTTFAGVAAQMISKHMENTDAGRKMAASKDVQVHHPPCRTHAAPRRHPCCCTHLPMACMPLHSAAAMMADERRVPARSMSWTASSRLRCTDHGTAHVLIGGLCCCLHGIVDLPRRMSSAGLHNLE
jgi:hypothetical protein